MGGEMGTEQQGSIYPQFFQSSCKPSVQETEEAKKEAGHRSKVEDSASGQPLMAWDGQYVEALASRVDMSAGLAIAAIPANPATATNTPMNSCPMFLPETPRAHMI